jgi:hypothetical protein
LEVSRAEAVRPSSNPDTEREMQRILLGAAAMALLVAPAAAVAQGHDHGPDAALSALLMGSVSGVR